MIEDSRKRDFWNERLSRHWGPEGAGSVAYGRQFNAWRYRVRTRVFNRLVRRLALQPAGLAVLDVGCGTGFYLGQWQSLGVRSVAGLDISDYAVAQLAPAFPKVMFYRADVASSPSPLPDEAFDVVSALDVLVHLVAEDSYLRGLRNIHRALKPGGYLLYSDSFFHGPDKQWQDYWKGRSLSSVGAAMSDVGFEILYRVPMSVLMAPPTDTRRRERCEAVWEMLMTPVRKREEIGFLAGALLYPLELLLVCTLKESPAIEIMVCRKRG